ncbi:MAG TPA: hypothetical protein VGL09_05085 [Methylomirabilota bacterium]|jgi:hypothetical protein
MIRWTLIAIGVLVAAGVIGATIARVLGRSGAPASLLVSVVSYWLAAWVLWSFAGGLAVHYSVLGAYPGGFFALLAVVGGIWHYRAARRLGRERALPVFVGVQLVWLVFVLIHNGIFGF